MGSAVGLYYSGIDLNGLRGEEEVTPRKISAVKPKPMGEKETPAPDEPEYTFFETLNDTTMTRYVDLHGKLLPHALPREKLTPPPPAKVALIQPVEQKEQSEALALSETEHKLKNETNAEVKARPGYAVQVSSFRSAESAGALKMLLQKNGFDAFLVKTDLADQGGIWHRVFMGRYADEQEAQRVAQLAKSQYKLDAVVVRKTN